MKRERIPSFILSYSDSGFTNPHEMVLPDDPHDCRGDYTHMGAKYWGLETERHVATNVLWDEAALTYDHNQHHTVDLAFTKRAIIHEVCFSTKWFTGNQVRSVSVILTDEQTGVSSRVLERVALAPDAERCCAIPPTVATECRLELYYEGGLSRVLFFGEPVVDQAPARLNLLKDAAISHVSNDHYGNPAMAVAGEREVMHMSGWESARTGFGERALFHLDRPVTPTEIVVDTYLHRLNAPLTCHLFALKEEDPASISAHMAQAPRWQLTFADGHTIIPDEFQQYMLTQAYLFEDSPQNTRVQNHPQP